MISADILNQLQLLIKSVAPPLIEVSKTPLERVPLQPGEHVQVSVLSNLPSGRFQVAIGDQLLDMNLPKNTQPGDTLEMTFVTSQPRLTFVMSRDIPLPTAASAPAPGSERANVAISDSARFLGALLDKVASTASEQAAPLAKSAPLLTSVPDNPVEMAQAMQKALSRSGLFYESHQAQWVAGERPLAELLKEPQAQLSRPGLLALQANLEQAAKTTGQQPAQTQLAASLARVAIAPEALLGQPLAEQSAANQPAASQSQPVANLAVAQNPEVPAQPAPSAQAVPAESMPNQQVPVRALPDQPVVAQPAQGSDDSPAPQKAALPNSLPSAGEAVHPKTTTLVQQQLNALDTHQLVWQGQVWPGQAMEWRIEERPDASPGAPAEASEWQTSLHLYLPNLGEVSAGIRLSRQGVHLHINSPRDSSVALMQQRQSELVSGLSAAGLDLVELALERANEKT